MCGEAGGSAPHRVPWEYPQKKELMRLLGHEGSLAGYCVGEAAVLKTGGVVGRHRQVTLARNCGAHQPGPHSAGDDEVPLVPGHLWPAPAARVQILEKGFSVSR